MTKIPMQFLMENAAALGAKAAAGELGALRELLEKATLMKTNTQPDGPMVSILLEDNDDADALFDLLQLITARPPYALGD